MLLLPPIPFSLWHSPFPLSLHPLSPFTFSHFFTTVLTPRILDHPCFRHRPPFYIDGSADPHLPIPLWFGALSSGGLTSSVLVGLWVVSEYCYSLILPLDTLLTFVPQFCFLGLACAALVTFLRPCAGFRLPSPLHLPRGCLFDLSTLLFRPWLLCGRSGGF